MKALITLTLLCTTAAADLGQNFYTAIDGHIYETPVPDNCPGCTVEFVKVHTRHRWIELRTDRISKRGFEND